MSTVISTHSVTIGSASPKFKWNQGSSTLYPYEILLLSVSQSGYYTISADTLIDAYNFELDIYNGTFNPLSPVDNNITWSGDYADFSLAISSVYLEQGVSYPLLISLYDNTVVSTTVSVVFSAIEPIQNYTTTTGLIAFESTVNTYSLGTQTPIFCSTITSEIGLIPNFTFPSYVLCPQITSEIGFSVTIAHQDNYMAVPSIKMRNWYIGDNSWEQLNGYQAMQMTQVTVPSGGLWIELYYISNFYSGSKKVGVKLSQNGVFYIVNPFNLYSLSDNNGIALAELQGLVTNIPVCYVFIPNETQQSVVYSSIKLWWGTWTEPTTNIETFGFWDRYGSKYTGDVALLPAPIIETSETYDVTGYNPYYLQGSPRRDTFLAGRGYFSYMRYDGIGQQDCAYEFIAVSNYAFISAIFYYNVSGDVSISLYELPSQTLIQKSSHILYNPTTNQQHNVFYNLKTGYKYRIQLSYMKTGTQQYTYVGLASAAGQTLGSVTEFAYKHNKVYKRLFDQPAISYLSEIATQLQIKSLYSTPVIEFLTEFINAKILFGATSIIDFESEISTFKDTVTIPTLADDVASKFSKAFIDKVLENEPMLNLFNGGSIEFYTGNRPASANHATTGQFLGAIHNLSFDTPISDNRIQKNSAQQWIFKGENTGVIGWFRIKLNSIDTDYGMDSLTNIRIDGEAGIDAISPDLNIKKGNACRLKNFAVTWSNA